jgi:hypothetical protein
MKRSPSLVAGLTICALLGILDLVGLLGLGQHPGPPVAVVISGGVLGVVTLAGAAMAWRRRRGSRTTVMVSRILDALLAAGVFFADDAPGWARVVVGIAIVATIVGVGLIATAARRPAIAVV